MDACYSGLALVRGAAAGAADPRKYQYFAKFDWPRVTNPKIHFPATKESLEAAARAEDESIDQARKFIAERKDDLALLVEVDGAVRGHAMLLRIDPDRAEMFKVAEGLRNEFCIQVKGLVRARPPGTTNDNLKSGKIEVLCHEIEVLNTSVTPPFQLDDENLSETTRLTHRVLDLRRPQMQKNMMLRYRVAMEVRKFLDANGFMPGPHGMHPLGVDWNRNHKEVFERVSRGTCEACHGNQLQGAVLARLPVTRTLICDEGRNCRNKRITLAAGTLISCGLCHENPRRR